MATDNVVLNAGSGGSTIRTLADASGNEWSAGVCCYATTVSAGANVLQVVTPSFGLPVAQQGSWTVTANAGTGTFTVSGTVTANAGTGTFTVQGGAASGATAAGNPVQVGGVFNTAQPTVTTGQAVQLQATARGGLIVSTGVDTFHVTVDNATLAVTQSGTWNVGTVTTVTTVSTLTSITNTVTVQGGAASGASAAGNPLQAGGVFNTTQPTVTTGQAVQLQATARGALIVATGVDTFTVAGSVTANAGTNLNTSALALDTSVNGLLLAQASTTSSQKGPLLQGAVTTSAPSYTTAQTSPLSLTTAGLLRVDASGTTVTVSGTVTANAGTGTFNIQANASVNVAQLAGTATDTNSGNKSAGTLRVVIATDQPALTNALKVDGSAVTQPVSGTVTANPAAATTGGATPGRYLAAASANQDSQNVKGSAGTLYWLVVVNVNAAVRYLKLYDKTTAPTSADTPVQTIGVPGNTAGAGVVLPLAGVGMAFANGIGFRMTTGQADNDTGAVTAGDLALSYGTK